MSVEADDSSTTGKKKPPFIFFCPLFCQLAPCHSHDALVPSKNKWREEKKMGWGRGLEVGGVQMQADRQNRTSLMLIEAEDAIHYTCPRLHRQNTCPLSGSIFGSKT